MLYRHKSDEGRNARQASFWAGEGMLAFGCYALSGTLGQSVSLRDSFGDLPFLGISLTGAFLIATLVFIVGSILWMRWLGQPKIADHLIEVEGEMNKVTWPSFSEATNSSIVVVVTILILMGFLALADWGLGRLFNFLLFQ